MNYRVAMRMVRRVRDENSRCKISWISPVVTSVAAALYCRGAGITENLNFSSNADTYAESNGLKALLNGQYSIPDGSGQQGRTYSALTQLKGDNEVEMCNKTINDIVMSQFNGFDESEVMSLAKVIGELHDNVSSHSNGVGYSCAQVYGSGDQKRIEFAIADCGKGMLSNVQKKNECIGHLSAIEWCLQRGYTTAGNDDDWAQRLPEDSIFSPYPKGVSIRSYENNHLGEGLWALTEMVRKLSGQVMIWSGDGMVKIKDGKRNSETVETIWNGVVIEFEVCVPLKTEQPVSQKAEDIGRRLKL